MKRVFVPGVFDVFHIGHLNYLKRASEAGDYIIVGVQDDRAVQACKGAKPMIPLAERMAILQELRFVDEVVSYTAVFQGPLLEGLEIDVFAVGEEYGESDQYPDQKRSLEFCRQRGVDVVRVPRTNHVSSTNIRGRLKEFWNARAKLNKSMPAGVTTLGSFQGNQEKVAAETAHEVDHILRAASSTELKSLLDLGCGDGRQLAHLCKRFPRIVGVDFAPDLLESAATKIAAAGGQAELVEGDVSEFLRDEKFDVLLLSGILPCLDDDQVRRMLANLRSMSHDNSVLLVRSSIGLTQRVDVVNQFSQELKTRYTAYYRTVDEIQADFAANGWDTKSHELLYQHREDTAVWWFEFAPQVAALRDTAIIDQASGPRAPNFLRSKSAWPVTSTFAE